MRKMEQYEAISGKEGRAYMKVNGNNEELFYLKSLEATVTKTKSEIKAVGRRIVGHKTTGMSGEGSMTVYYMSPLFREMLGSYKDNGKDLYFDIVVENDDPSSSAGKQVVQLMGCNLDSTLLAKLDGDSDDVLEEECDFTFDDWTILTAFTK